MWGYHVILDCSSCLPHALRSKKHIEQFAKTLVKRIDMVPYGPPQVIHFGSDNKAGFTLVQLIETSNITAHFVEATNDIYIDVFSCKAFNPKEVEDVVNHFFKPKASRVRFVERQAPPQKLE